MERKHGCAGRRRGKARVERRPKVYGIHISFGHRFLKKTLENIRKKNLCKEKEYSGKKRCPITRFGKPETRAVWQISQTGTHGFG